MSQDKYRSNPLPHAFNIAEQHLPQATAEHAVSQAAYSSPFAGVLDRLTSIYRRLRHAEPRYPEDRRLFSEEVDRDRLERIVECLNTIEPLDPVGIDLVGRELYNDHRAALPHVRNIVRMNEDDYFLTLSDSVSKVYRLQHPATRTWLLDENPKYGGMRKDAIAIISPPLYNHVGKLHIALFPGQREALSYASLGNVEPNL